MNSLALALAPLLAMQHVGDQAVAITNENPETWTIVYPRPLYRFVDDYRRCLRIQMRRITGEADFEAQHRSDAARCAEVREQAITDGYARLVANGTFQDFDEAAVRQIFDDVDRIHIARGADLDQQFTLVQRMRQEAREEYEANKPRGLVLELHDASVVKARTDATAAAAEAAYQERERQRAERQEEARGAND